MFRRIPQPPINPALRNPERHSFWPGFIASVLALVFLFCGARHLTGIETTDGNAAWETQLVKAYSSGGLRYGEHISSPPPPVPGDPVATAAALERWERDNAGKLSDHRLVRIDTAADTPCPT